MATAVDAALAEVNAALASLAPPREGLKDFDRLNIHPDTQAIVRESIVLFDQRWDLLQQLKGSLEAILNDGYPTLAVRQIPASAFEDLKDNAATIEAAFATFSEATATALGLSSGIPEIKP